MLAALIGALHLAFIAFMFVAPFTSNPRWLVLHFLTGPLLFLHWYLMDDTCALTLLECHVRGVPADQSFMGRLVGPVYNAADSDVSSAVWVITLALWAVSACKVLRRPAMFREVLLGQGA